MKIQISIKNVAILLVFSLIYLVPRIVDLGFDVINIDYPLWDNRATNFYIYLKTFNFAETYRTSHPGVTLMWIGGGAIEVFSRLYQHFFGTAPVISEFSIFPWRSIFISLALVFSLLSLYLIAVILIEKIFNRKVALLFFILLSLEPYIIAHDRIFHLDGLLTALIFVSCLSSIYFWKILKFRFLFASSVFASLAFLTKIAGIFAFLFFFLSAGVYGKIFSSRKHFRKLLNFFLLFALFVVLFFPAMWVYPVGVLSKLFSESFSMSEIGHSQFFLGRWSDDPGVLFYPLVFLFKSSPFIILCVLLLMIWCLCNRQFFVKMQKSSVSSFKEVILLALLILFYLVEISLSPKKVPRYILPIFPPLLLIMSLSIVGIYKRSADRLKRYLGVIFVSAIFVTVYAIYKTYPDFLAYTNPLLGGMKSADYYIGNKHFGFGLKSVAEYMNKKPYAEEIKLIFDGDGSIAPFFVGMARNTTYIYRDHISTADYFLLPYYLIEKDPMFLEYKKDFTLEKVFAVNSYPYWYLYRNVRR